MDGQRTIYTPSELNHEARLHLEAGFGRIWLEGEISNLSRPASGHLYFSIKDEKAYIRCALFRSNSIKIPFRPEDGMQVQARGRVSLYEARGDYQLIVDTMEEAGEGRLRAAFEALKNQLRDEGLFDADRKQPLPRFPLRVGVITSPGGAVIRDILNVLRRRWPLARVRLYPVPVQGNEAAPAIGLALAAANRHGWAEAIILGRGGGSLEDLQAFNEESVARAVALSLIPVISAVGHETDFSIADFVADMRAPTPSAAAELLAPDSKAISQLFSNLALQLRRRMLGHLQGLAQKHDHLAHRLGRQHPGQNMQQHRKLLSQLVSRLTTAGRRLIPDRMLGFGHSAERLINAGSQLVIERRRRLQELAHTLNAVSPLPTLDRGYAMVTDPGGEQIISSVTQLKPGDPIATQLRDGTLFSTIDRITDEKLNKFEPE